MSIPDLTPLVLSLLVREPAAPDLAEAELERIQHDHVAWVESLRERGITVAAGPWIDQPDERVRGAILYRGISVEEAQALAADDPVVRAGRTRHEVCTWLTPTASPVVALLSSRGGAAAT